MSDVFKKCVKISPQLYMEAYKDSISFFHVPSGQEVFIDYKFFQEFQEEFNQMAAQVLSCRAKEYENNKKIIVPKGYKLFNPYLDSLDDLYKKLCNSKKTDKGGIDDYMNLQDEIMLDRLSIL